jgi:hypothetical protein
MGPIHLLTSMTGHAASGALWIDGFGMPAMQN